MPSLPRCRAIRRLGKLRTIMSRLRSDRRSVLLGWHGHRVAGDSSSGRLGRAMWWLQVLERRCDDWPWPTRLQLGPASRGLFARENDRPRLIGGIGFAPADP